jgi:Family of unknown function (DUF6081)
VTIPRFSLSDDTFQSADSPKYLIFSTHRFKLPPDRSATFAVDLAVENIGVDPGGYRRGMAAFRVFDLDVSKRVFAICGTSARVFALHEELGLGEGGSGEPFYHVVESPYADFDGRALSSDQGAVLRRLAPALLPPPMRCDPLALLRA